jgi:hypothetical protein
MPNYENSIIYKLCHCNDLENNNIYIGSTTNFRNRKYQHKNSCFNEKRKDYYYPVYQFIRDNDGWDNWQMIPIEVFPCNDKKELEVRERHHIELLKPKLNKIIPTRTEKEYKEDNKEKITEYKKQHYNNNKEQILEQQKDYYQDNKEQILEQQKDYYQDNKEQILEYHKKYYEANKAIISEKAKEKVICDHCRCEVSKCNLARHQKTKKCIDSI